LERERERKRKRESKRREVAIATLTTSETRRYAMFTLLITFALVALISFGVGVSYERAHNEALSLQAEYDRQDAEVFEDWGIDPGFVSRHSWDHPRPHLKLVSHSEVDKHFDDLVARGLVEPS
jgi:hypothetical protein